MIKKFLCACLFLILSAGIANAQTQTYNQRKNNNIILKIARDRFFDEFTDFKRIKTATNKTLSQSALKNFVPYLFYGALSSMHENWEMLSDAYDDDAEWSQALQRTGIDFAGYGVTPYLLDGVLASSGKQVVLMSSLKNAGMSFTLGCFCWDAGREYFSYANGEISGEEFCTQMKQNTAQKIEMLPVNILAYMVSASGQTFFVPCVIIAGSFAIERVHQWYEDKRWLNTVYLDDERAILGEDLINLFNISNPEHRQNLVNPKKYNSVTNPKQRKNLIQAK